ncbi:GNAT family N-acetyltransferase [Deinococcus misasensis]|uniref:GNAT family N-acetyltransferase n=1 Tax=Deinococcus misasensis TaxID=392413 RepID=UPI00068BE101|nr:GNAT family N-acetyltransferase [Deinococcus misasensis]
MTPTDLHFETLHTSQLSSDFLLQLRDFLSLVYEEDFADEDWDHALGGVHILVRHENQLVGHAAVVQRQLYISEKAFRVGYLEAMAVHPQFQRQGIGRQMMAQVNHLIQRAYDFGALGASDEGFGLYLQTGWQVWPGELGVLSFQGIERTPEEEGGVMVYPAFPEDPSHMLICDFRSGDVW